MSHIKFLQHTAPDNIGQVSFRG